MQRHFQLIEDPNENGWWSKQMLLILSGIFTELIYAITPPFPPNILQTYGGLQTWGYHSITVAFTHSHYGPLIARIQSPQYLTILSISYLRISLFMLQTKKKHETQDVEQEHTFFFFLSNLSSVGCCTSIWVYCTLTECNKLKCLHKFFGMTI